MITSPSSFLGYTPIVIETNQQQQQQSNNTDLMTTNSKEEKKRDEEDSNFHLSSQQWKQLFNINISTRPLLLTSSSSTSQNNTNSASTTTSNNKSIKNQETTPKSIKISIGNSSPPMYVFFPTELIFKYIPHVSDQNSLFFHEKLREMGLEFDEKSSFSLLEKGLNVLSVLNSSSNSSGNVSGNKYKFIDFWNYSIPFLFLHSNVQTNNFEQQQIHNIVRPSPSTGFSGIPNSPSVSNTHSSPFTSNSPKSPNPTSPKTSPDNDQLQQPIQQQQLLQQQQQQQQHQLQDQTQQQFLQQQQQQQQQQNIITTQQQAPPEITAVADNKNKRTSKVQKKGRSSKRKKDDPPATTTNEEMKIETQQQVPQQQLLPQQPQQSQQPQPQTTQASTIPQQQPQQQNQQPQQQHQFQPYFNSMDLGGDAFDTLTSFKKDDDLMHLSDTDIDLDSWTSHYAPTATTSGSVNQQSQQSQQVPIGLDDPFQQFQIPQQQQPQIQPQIQQQSQMQPQQQMATQQIPLQQQQLQQQNPQQPTQQQFNQNQIYQQNQNQIPQQQKPQLSQQHQPLPNPPHQTTIPPQPNSQQNHQLLPNPDNLQNKKENDTVPQQQTTTTTTTTNHSSIIPGLPHQNSNQDLKQNLDAHFLCPVPYKAPSLSQNQLPIHHSDGGSTVTPDSITLFASNESSGNHLLDNSHFPKGGGVININQESGILQSSVGSSGGEVSIRVSADDSIDGLATVYRNLTLSRQSDQLNKNKFNMPYYCAPSYKPLDEHSLPYHPKFEYSYTPQSKPSSTVLHSKYTPYSSSHHHHQKQQQHHHQQQQQHHHSPPHSPIIGNNSGGKLHRSLDLESIKPNSMDVDIKRSGSEPEVPTSSTTVSISIDTPTSTLLPIDEKDPSNNSNNTETQQLKKVESINKSTNISSSPSSTSAYISFFDQDKKYINNSSSSNTTSSNNISYEECLELAYIIQNQTISIYDTTNGYSLDTSPFMKQTIDYHMENWLNSFLTTGKIFSNSNTSNQNYHLLTEELISDSLETSIDPLSTPATLETTAKTLFKFSKDIIKNIFPLSNGPLSITQFCNGLINNNNNNDTDVNMGGVINNNSPPINNNNNMDFEWLAIPKLIVGYKEEWLEVPFTTIRYWDKAQLEPYSPKKNITYFVLCPDTPTMKIHVPAFFSDLSCIYETNHLGNHMPQPSNSVFHNGICYIQSGHPNGAEFNPQVYINSYLLACVKISDYLKNLSTQYMENNCIVLYIVNPFTDISQFKFNQDATKKNTSSPNMFTDDQNNLKDSFSFISSCFQSLLRDTSLHESLNITIQIIPAEQIFLDDSSQYVPTAKEVAFTIFNKCRRISTLSSVLCGVSNNNNSSGSNCEESNLQCSYMVSDDKKWISCTVTDDRGELLENKLIPLGFSESTGEYSWRESFQNFWFFITEIIGLTLISNCNIVIGKLGIISYPELNEWTRILKQSQFELNQHIASRINNIIFLNFTFNSNLKLFSTELIFDSKLKQSLIGSVSSLKGQSYALYPSSSCTYPYNITDSDEKSNSTPSPISTSFTITSQFTSQIPSIPTKEIKKEWPQIYMISIISNYSFNKNNPINCFDFQKKITRIYHRLSYLNISPRYPDRFSVLPIHFAITKRMSRIASWISPKNSSPPPPLVNRAPKFTCTTMKPPMSNNPQTTTSVNSPLTCQPLSPQSLPSSTNASPPSLTSPQ
eukprot:gene448-567_t